MSFSHREWDAGSYHRVSEPQLEWGRAVLERLAPKGDETVVDAGCGTGRVTRLLAERLPRGRIVAVDGSVAMVQRAAAELADLGDRVRFVHADLVELELDEPADAVISTATFHWIGDHGALFRRLAAALVPGGRLVAQCGGAGNLDGLLVAIEAAGDRPDRASLLAGVHDAWNFATPQQTEAQLRAAGFAEARAWLEDAPVVLDAGGEAEEFLATVVLRPHLARLAEDQRRPFVEEVTERAARDGQVLLDYTRLNMDGRTPA